VVRGSDGKYYVIETVLEYKTSDGYKGSIVKIRNHNE